MMRLELVPEAGHITSAINAAVEIATAFPQYTFRLTFNSRTMNVTTSEEMHKEYFR